MLAIGGPGRGMPFVGRERELAALRDGLAAAGEGDGSVALLAGEPGIGKTRLVEELAALAHDNGIGVLWGRCFEGEGAPPLWPWVQILRAATRRRDADALRADLGDAAPDIAQLVPEVRRLLPDLREPPALEPAQARFRQFDAVSTFLLGLASDRPLLVALDDLQWADAASLLLLQFLGRELSGSRLLLVGVYRDAALARGHPLAGALADLARGPRVSRLSLTGLAMGEVARVVEGATGTAAAANVVQALRATTGGNPLFVLEMIRLLAQEGRLRDAAATEHLGVPATVREVIGRRLDRLSAESVRVLTVAAVIGQEFGIDVLAGVGELAGETLQAVLEEAEVARIIQATAPAPDRYRFTHALIRETLYEQLSTIGRARLHLRIAEAVERVHQRDLADHVATLAVHYRLGVPASAEVRPKAITYARRAGEAAMAVFAWEEAVSHLQAALALAGASDPPIRCELLLALGEAQNRTGDRTAAKETFIEAARAARQLSGEPPAAAQGAATLLARAALGFGGAGVTLAARDERQVALLEEALAVAGGPEPDAGPGPDEPPAPSSGIDDGLHARLLARLGLSLFWTPERRRGAALSRAAVAVARRSADSRALIEALHVRRYMLAGADRLAERLGFADEMLRLADALGDPELVLQGLRWRIVDRLELGDMAAVEAAVERYDQLAQRAHQPYYRWYAALFRAMCALSSGRYAEAEELAARALALGRQAGDADAEAFFTVQLWAVRAEEGRLAELEEAVRDLAGRYAALVAYRCRLAALYAEIGRGPEARREFERVVRGTDRQAREFFARLARDGNGLISLAHLARTALYLGDLERAGLLYDALLPYAGHNVVSGAAILSGGPVAHWLGVLAAALGRRDQATAHFEAALSMSARLGSPPQMAATQAAYAALLLDQRRSGDIERARPLLEQALATARQLSMQPLTGSIARLAAESRLQLAGLSRPEDAPVHPHTAPARPGRSSPVHLTDREAEILRLLAAGHTNAEIAAALVISAGTVKRHAENIYTKIGARGRADAVAFALRHGLLDSH